MIRFSASEAALEGFRLTRERPGVIFGWGVVFIVSFFLIGQLILLMLAPKLGEIPPGQRQDIQHMSALLAQSWPTFILAFILANALWSTITAGIYRIILRPGEKGFLHLRLGADELRIMGLNLFFFACGMPILAAWLAAVAAASQGSWAASVAALVIFLCAVWVGVRLSLATPMAFAERRLAVRDAWAMSRGKFWPLFGMIILAVIFYVMVWLLFSIIGAALIGLAGGAEALENIGGLSGPALVSVALYVFLQLILQVIQLVMIYAPFAVAYQQVHGDPPANPLRASAQNG